MPFVSRKGRSTKVRYDTHLECMLYVMPVEITVIERICACTHGAGHHGTAVGCNLCACSLDQHGEQASLTYAKHPGYLGYTFTPPKPPEVKFSDVRVTDDDVDVQVVLRSIRERSTADVAYKKDLTHFWALATRVNASAPSFALMPCPACGEAVNDHRHAMYGGPSETACDWRREDLTAAFRKHFLG